MATPQFGKTTPDAVFLAVAGAVSVVLAMAPAQAQHKEHKGKEKCYGVAKAGENACHAANGNHSCAGKAKSDHAGQDWLLVEIGTCMQMGGRTSPFDEAAIQPKATVAPKGG